jgi:hypothetical protein
MRTPIPRRRGPARAATSVALVAVASLAATLIDPSAVPAQAAPADRPGWTLTASAARHARTLAAWAARPLTENASPPGSELAYYEFTDYDRDNKAQNSVPNGGDATLQNGAIITNDSVWPQANFGRSLKLDGVDDFLSSPVVVPLDKSFTVTAWTKLDEVDRSQVVLSQDGTRASGFVLKADANGKWVFGMPKTDSETAGWDTATGPAAVAGQWTQLTGVFDTAAGEMRLYVNGTKVATTKHTAGWTAGGGLRAGRGLSAGKPADFVGGNVDEIHAWSTVLSDEALGELVVPPSIARADRCDIGHWLHAGGPEVKAVASRALAGTDYDRRAAYQAIGLSSHQLEQARVRDDDAYREAYSAQSDRYSAWESVIKPLKYWGDDFISFWSAPEYGDEVHRFLLERNDETFHNYFVPPPPPKPTQEALDRALAIAADMRAHSNDWSAPEDWQVKGWSANRIERFLRFGGWPTVTPAPGSLEFRTEVESIKINWADCDPDDPDGVIKPGSWTGEPGPMAEVTLTAKREWNAELAAQATQRNDIVRAEIQTMKDVRTASAAMVETQGQAWVAGQLLKWQKYWLSRPKTDSDYPKPAEFAKANQDLATARDRVNAQLTIAKNAAASAKTQVDKASAAQKAAADIATASGTPMYRGLAYARQSAQVAKASAAAAQAAAKAIETTLNAVKAANADGKALQALAATQQAAQQAEFRRVAAQEAAAQAKAAADAAASQAQQAAQMAARAKDDRAKAEKAEAAARTAVEGAHQKRLVAEKERGNAAAARAKADAERAKAHAAEAEAQQQQARAATARQNAQTHEGTAADKAGDAEEAEARARRARDEAVAAERRRDQLAARAQATEAAAAAAQGTSDAKDARDAANQARADANEASSAATAARTAANQASAAAVAARAAATEADGAATRSRAAADGAQADANTAHSQAATAHYAAADAINAAQAAADNVKAAEAEARKAEAAAAKARAEAAEARNQANIAQQQSAVTAGQAFAAAQAALAASDAAMGAVNAAKEAISLGTPYRDVDASAGMAVLVGQSAKTLAEQQEAAAKVRADEAAKAAQAAKEAAARANADAKAAADAAAAAAADAVRAMESVKQARISAAAAATDAAAAQRAAANAAEYDQQAAADAMLANRAANDAESDAAAARAAATDAERDAASARAAADTAERDAATARALAAQADKEATEAERDAANARAYAEQADRAATNAEDEARRAEQERRAGTLNGGSDAPGGGGTALTAEEEELLRAECGDSCVAEYRKALADAGKTILQWIKENGVEVLLDVIGYTDLKNCFTTGDVEACLWTLVNVASLVAVAGKLPAVSKAIVRVGEGITKFLEASAAGKRTLDRLRKIIERVKKARKPRCPKVAAAKAKHGVRATEEPCMGSINRGELADHEFEQASELVDELGGHFEGQTVSNQPGIDGHYNGQPASLKTVQPGSVNNIRALANAMTNANKSAKNAKIANVILFIKAPGMTKAEVATSRRAAEILQDGILTKISVRASDGWVHF